MTKLLEKLNNYCSSDEPESEFADLFILEAILENQEEEARHQLQLLHQAHEALRSEYQGLK